MKKWLFTVPLVAVVATLLPACSSDGGTSGPSAACVRQNFSFEGQQYGTALPESDAKVQFTVGRKLGTATVLGCNDMGDAESAGTGETIDVYAIDELPSEAALALDTGASRMRLLSSYSDAGQMDERTAAYIKQERAS